MTHSPYRYRPVAFFVVVFLITGVAEALAAHYSVTADGRGASMALSLIALLAPCTVASFMIATSGSAALKRDFKNRLMNLRLLGLRYVAFSVLMPLCAVVLSIAVSILAGKSADQFHLVHDVWRWIPLLLMAPLLEELGWRGYAVDSLRSRLGLLQTALVFSVLWSLWHAPLFFIAGTYHHDLIALGGVYVVNFFVSVIPAGIIGTWLYYKCDRSIVAVVVFHFMVDLFAMFFSAEQFTKCIVTVLYIVTALCLILLDRKFFLEGSRNFIEDRTGSVGSLAVAPPLRS